MNINEIHREITPLTEGECFLVFDRERKIFDFPIHFHPEFELNLMLNAKGVKRIVGDSIEYIDNFELVLVGPTLIHGWQKGKAESNTIREVTIQFHRDLFHESLMNKNIMKPIKEMFKRSSRGILFSQDIADWITIRIINLVKKSSIDSYIELINLLFDLASSRNQIILSASSSKNEDFYNNGEIKNVHDFILQNFANGIKVKEMAEMLNMTVVSFSRFIKKRTGKTFVGYLNDMRLGFAARWLLETDMNVAEIAFKCGFNNIGYFNRVFKKAKGCTPVEFKENFTGNRKFS